MGVLFDYFSARSDEAAATAINRGPSVSSEDSPSLPVFDTLETKGICPIITLGQLEALRTGRDPLLRFADSASNNFERGIGTTVACRSHFTSKPC